MSTQDNPNKIPVNIPQQIKMTLTGNILTRYDGPPHILVIHRRSKGEPLTTTFVCTGDYLGSNEHQSPLFLYKNPERWSPIPEMVIVDLG